MSANLLPNGKQAFVSALGIPLVGGLLYTYAAGTNTPAPTWKDSAQSAANTNPVILDARGEASVFWNGAYKIVLEDALGNLIWTQDNVSALDFVAIISQFTGNLAAATGAGLVGYAETDGGTNIGVMGKLRQTLTGLFASTMMVLPTAASAVLRLLTDILFERGLSIASFGAKTTNTAPQNLAAFMACLAACKTLRVPLLIPAGNFPFGSADQSPITIDPTYTDGTDLYAVPIIGLGAGISKLNLTQPPTINSVALRFAASDEWYHPRFEGFSVTGNYPGVLLALGADNFSDPLNILTIRDVAVLNSANSPSNVALRLNYIAPDSVAFGLTCNSYAAVDGSGNLTAVAGTALQCRQVTAMVFVGGSAGNADIGFDVKDGVNVGISITGFTFENVRVGFSHRSSISGAHRIEASQFSNYLPGGYPIQSTGCITSQWIEFEACNFTVSGMYVDPANYTGVYIKSRVGIVAPVPSPTLNTAYVNTTGHPVIAACWGGNVSSVTIDGVTRSNPIAGGSLAIAEFNLPPGSAISFGGTTAPSWTWSNRGG